MISICKECNLEKKIKAKGLCSNCYNKLRNKRRKVYFKERHKKNYNDRKAYFKKYYKKNRKRILIHLRNRNYIRLYGITLDEYNEIFRKQGGKCAICGKKPLTYNLSIDHDHDTGKMRDLLCPICNYVVGIVENSNLISKVNEYIKKHKEVK
jgi:hypothetical protein